MDPLQALFRRFHGVFGQKPKVVSVTTREEKGFAGDHQLVP